VAREQANGEAEILKHGLPLPAPGQRPDDNNASAAIRLTAGARLAEEPPEGTVVALSDGAARRAVPSGPGRRVNLT